jgi:hypothetical protein
MRYRRGLSNNALTIWIAESLPERLLSPILNCIPSDPCALDIQLREGGVLQVYHGNTSILRIIANELGSDVRLQFNTRDSEVKASWPSLKRRWPIDEVDKLGQRLREILPALVARISPTYYRNEKEGYWENRICYSYGRSWTPGKEWLVLDRQAVIGFASSADRTKFYEPIVSKHAAAMQSTFETQGRRWAQPKTLGGELDLLLLSRRRELVCMELKHAASSAGVYYGSFQAAVYREAFYSATDSIIRDIAAMAKQKIALRLLPAEAVNMFPIAQPVVVHGVLAVVGNPSLEVKTRLKICLACCEEIECRSISEESFR